jgi:hypothetical protein
VSGGAHLNDGADCLGFAKQTHELVLQLRGRLFVAALLVVGGRYPGTLGQNRLFGRLLHQDHVGDPRGVRHLVCHLKNSVAM